MEVELKIGDVFELKDGMRIITNTPLKFINSAHMFSTKIDRCNIDVGSELKNYDYEGEFKNHDEYLVVIGEMVAKALSGFKIVANEKDINEFLKKIVSCKLEKFVFNAGEFVIIDVHRITQNGEIVANYHSSGYAGLYIVCRRLGPNGEYDEKGDIVEMRLKAERTTDGHTVYANNGEFIAPIRRMKQAFIH